MSIFSRLFGGGKRKPIEEMSFWEVADFIKRNPNDIPADDLIAAARRLTDIAMFDHASSDQERALALEVLPAIDRDIEQGFRDKPEAWEAYLEAVSHHRGQARHFGYGSLQWRMDEAGLEAAEVLPFLARKEHAELLPAFLEMLEPDDVLQIRSALIGELARARSEGDGGTLEVLHRLATTGDGALTLLLDGRQLGAIARAPADPGAAEAVLAELGLTPGGAPA